MLRTICLFLLFATPCIALANSDNTPLPVEIVGDYFYYDQDKKAFIAKGSVRVAQGKEIVLADEIIYLKAQDKLFAKGNIAVLREDRSIYYADVLNLENKMHQGKLLSFKARLGKTGLFAASGAKMIDKEHIKLYSLVFSPCKVCQDNFKPYTPLWQIRASEAEINLEKERVYYKNARIEANGVPVIYTPYFSTPTPNAKRKTGFLPPDFSRSNTLGSYVSLPFYLNISSNKDLTYTPSISTNKKTPMLHNLEFRHKLKNGSYKIDGSMLKNKRLNKNGQASSEQYIYGHINATGDFSRGYSNSPEFYGFQAQRVRDPSLTYTKLYNLMPEDVLTSKLYYLKLANTYYLDLETIAFQDLRPGRFEVTTPNALPLLRFLHEDKFEQINANSRTTASILKINRLQGTSYNRITVQNELMRQILLSNGHKLSISSKILGEVYQVSKTSIKNPAAQNSNTKGTAGDYGRFNPQIKAQWSYPLINQFNKSSIILEPTVQFIISPKQHMSSKIPNEDSQNFELSSGNLFSDNRYLGTDIIETGSRINYGIRSTVNNLFMSKIGLLAGQSYRLTNSHYPTSSGLQDKLSDYVAQLVYEPLNNLTVIHRIRFDHNNGAINRNEINLAYQYKQLFLSADYHSSSKKALSYADVFSKEISLAAKYNFYQSWWAIGNLRRNIGKKPVGITTNMIENSIGLHYLGQCLNLGVEVKRDYTKLKNVAPNTLYQVKIEIPTF